MNAEHTHVPAYCMIDGCKEEATRWYDTTGTPFQGVPHNTFYLCGDHASEMSPEDDVVQILDMETGAEKEVELAVYSCSEECKVCNE